VALTRVHRVRKSAHFTGSFAALSGGNVVARASSTSLRIVGILLIVLLITGAGPPI
jgi:hypothetical protein